MDEAIFDNRSEKAAEARADVRREEKDKARQRVVEYVKARQTGQTRRILKTDSFESGELQLGPITYEGVYIHCMCDRHFKIWSRKYQPTCIFSRENRTMEKR